MISFFQAIVLGLVQGVTELFPISSLGHSVLLPGILVQLGFTGWRINQNADAFITFLVATHFATALVLFCIYWRDWVGIIRGMVRSLIDREISAANASGRLGWLLVVATIPVGIVGLLFQTQVQNFFLAPAFAAGFLILNGGLLFAAEFLRWRAGRAKKYGELSGELGSEISWWQSVKIGVLQIFALIPGFSRTGSTIAGGLLAGLSHEDAVRFSFLLATPIIGAAALLKLPPLVMSAIVSGNAGAASALEVAVVGALAAALAAYFSATFLARYFRERTKTLTPFAIYCIVVGAVGLLILH